MSVETWTDEVARIKAEKEARCSPDVDPVLADISCRLTSLADWLSRLTPAKPDPERQTDGHQHFWMTRDLAEYPTCTLCQAERRPEMLVPVTERQAAALLAVWVMQPADPRVLGELESARLVYHSGVRWCLTWEGRQAAQHGMYFPSVNGTFHDQ